MPPGNRHFGYGRNLRIVNDLMLLARQNGGVYHYVDTRGFNK